ncbi:hypothetical protein CCACVL1_00604 [Corchorus capsularis]|uniref:Uncharacterized protein n=1 Tax=Corchorus capsularis TaxID=210143 RepID=A0A1R3KVW5_COCAP|nr:hypothetical protein CCACVL1_00604 [Corchorus capsularis]
MADNSVKFMLPDCYRLWEVPLAKDETFGGKPWEKVMHDSGIHQDNDLWSSTANQEK